MTSKGGDYEVGYGKPPKHSQYKKGCDSPNPGGRPPKNPTPGEILEKVMFKPTKVLVDGKATRMPIIEVALTNLVSKATKDVGAMKVLVALLPLLPKINADLEDPMLDAQLIALVSKIAGEKGQDDE